MSNLLHVIEGKRVRESSVDCVFDPMEPFTLNKETQEPKRLKIEIDLADIPKPRYIDQGFLKNVNHLRAYLVCQPDVRDFENMLERAYKDVLPFFSSKARVQRIRRDEFVESLLGHRQANNQIEFKKEVIGFFVSVIEAFEFELENPAKVAKRDFGEIAFHEFFALSIETFTKVREAINKSVQHKEKCPKSFVYSTPSFLTFLPQDIQSLSCLTRLCINNQKLVKLPQEIVYLSNLTELFVSQCYLYAVPNSLEQLKNLKHLVLNGNQFSEFPTSILLITSLTHLDLSENNFTQVPHEIEQLDSLVDLSFSGMRKSPFVLSDCLLKLPKLRSMILSQNPGIGQMTPIVNQLRRRNVSVLI